MKKLLFVFMVLIPVMPLFSQSDFIAPGAAWTFEEVTYNWSQPPHPHVSFKLLEFSYVGDTTVDGKDYKFIEGGMHPWLLREQDGVVYYMHPDLKLERVFWDFNVSVGDTIYLQLYHNDDPLVGLVDSMYLHLINGIESTTFVTRFWHGTKQSDTLLLLFNSRLGFIDNFLWILQTIHFGTDECWHCHTLRCYTDDEIPLYNPEDIPCDSLRPGTTSNKIEANLVSFFTINPNPIIDDQVWVYIADDRLSGRLQFSLFDMQGRQVQQWSQTYYQNSTYLLDIPPGLTTGAYILRLEDGQGHFWQEKLMIAR